MADDTPPIGMPQALGPLIRGLSALFWGLPLALLIGSKTALQDWLRPLGMTPAIGAAGLLLYGLIQLSAFQPQERVWILAVERAKLLALVNLGLSPFLYWWNKAPEVPLFGYAVLLLLLSSLLFLWNLNHLLNRLVAMLPDETLRGETHFFTAFNRSIVTLLLVLVALSFTLSMVERPSAWVVVLRWILDSARQWLVVVLVLLPVALTMTLLWKIKEALLESLFHQRELPR